MEAKLKTNQVRLVTPVLSASKGIAARPWPPWATQWVPSQARLQHETLSQQNRNQCRTNEKETQAKTTQWDKHSKSPSTPFGNPALSATIAEEN